MKQKRIVEKEERGFVRIPCRFVLDYREYDLRPSRGSAEVSESLNISGSGLGLETCRHVPAGTLLEVTLRIPGWYQFRTTFIKPRWEAEPEPLVLLGTVVRCEKRPSQARYDVGIAFTDMDPGDRHALLTYLEKCQEEPRRCPAGGR